jgi:hypothetical protein
LTLVVRLAAVINLEVFGESAAMKEVAELLDDVDGVSRVRLLDATRSGCSIVVAAVRPRVADALLGELRGQGVPDTDITLSRIELVARAAHDRAEASFVWEDVLGMAWLNARPLARYLAFMFVAGVVACYGVIERNVILIVGAMAISPDLLPITAVAVGLVGRRLRLAGQALLTLALGLAVSSGAAAIFALAQDWLDLIPAWRSR